MRVLVTGSRDWDDEAQLYAAFAAVFLDVGKEKVSLVSGNCPTGADKMAEDLFKAMGYEIERHPADWGTFGKRAGYIRNQAMVDSGPDLCVGFVKNNSRGASMTVKLAEGAGIKTYVYRQD